MTDGPDWAETLSAVKKVPGKGRTKNDRLGMDQVAQWQEFQQQRTGADVAVAVGAVDTGDDFDGWGAVTEWASNTVGNIQGVLNGIVRGWRGIPDAVGSADDVQVILGEARRVQFGMITLGDLSAASKNVPFWVSSNPFEDVSFPRSQLQAVPVYTITGTTAEADGSTTLHSHGVGSLALSKGTPLRPLYTIPAGTLALGAVRVGTDVADSMGVVRNTVRFIAGGDTPGGALLCGLYKIDPTTGTTTLVYDFGDVSNEVDTGSKLYECSLEMTADITAEAGELFQIGLLPIGASFTVAGIPRSEIVPDPVIYPQAATELVSGQSSLPSSVTDASMTHTATHRIWVSLGVALADTVQPVTIVVDFNAYANNGNWSSPACANFQNNASAVWAIQDGKLRVSGPSTLGVSSYRKASLVLQRCDTDNIYAEIVIGSGWTNADSGYTDRAYVRSNISGTEAVGMFVQQDGTADATVTIQTVADLLNTGTTRATSSSSFKADIGDTFRIEAVYDDTDGYTTYTCYRNGDPIPGAEWADTGNVAPRGVAWRRVAFSAHCASYNFGVWRPASIDAFRAGDLT